MVLALMVSGVVIATALLTTAIAYLLNKLNRS